MFTFEIKYIKYSFLKVIKSDFYRILKFDEISTVFNKEQITFRASISFESNFKSKVFISLSHQISNIDFFFFFLVL